MYSSQQYLKEVIFLFLGNFRENVTKQYIFTEIHFKYKYLEVIKQFEHFYWDPMQACGVKAG